LYSASSNEVAGEVAMPQGRTSSAKVDHEELIVVVCEHADSSSEIEIVSARVGRCRQSLPRSRSSRLLNDASADVAVARLSANADLKARDARWSGSVSPMRCVQVV